MLVLLILACVALDVIREILFRLAARNERADTFGEIAIFERAIPAALMWGMLGAIVWGVEILLWAFALARLPLNVAFPLMSLTYAATPLAGKFLFGETITSKRWLGIGFVTIGVMIVGAVEQV